MPILTPDLITYTVENTLSPYELLDLSEIFDREDETTLRSNDLWLKFLKRYFPGKTDVIKKMEACVLKGNLVKSGTTESTDAMAIPDGIVKQEFVRLAKELCKNLRSEKFFSLVGAGPHLMDDYFIHRVFKLTTPKEVKVKLQELCEHSNLILDSIDDPELMKFFLSLYPKNSQFEKAEQKYEEQFDQITNERIKRKNGLLLHRALRNPESFKILLNLYPVDKLMEVLKIEDNAGFRLLDRAAENVELLKAILDLIPIEEKMSVVEKKSRDGNTLLHSAATRNESLNFILNFYPPNKRIAAIEQRNKSQRTVLHCACANSESLQVLLSQYPEGERRAALEQRDNIGRTTLNLSNSYPETIKLILSLYPVNERLKAATDESQLKSSLIHEVARCNPKSLPIIINLLPEHHQILILKKIVDKTSIAEISTKNKLTFDNSFIQDYLFIVSLLNQNDTNQKRGVFDSSQESAAIISADWDNAQSFDEIKKMVINFLSHPENSKSVLGRNLLNKLVKGEDKNVDALAKEWSISLDTLSQKQMPVDQAASTTTTYKTLLHGAISTHASQSHPIDLIVAQFLETVQAILSLRETDIAENGHGYRTGGDPDSEASYAESFLEGKQKALDILQNVTGIEDIHGAVGALCALEVTFDGGAPPGTGAGHAPRKRCEPLFVGSMEKNLRHAANTATTPAEKSRGPLG